MMFPQTTMTSPKLEPQAQLAANSSSSFIKRLIGPREKQHGSSTRTHCESAQHPVPGQSLGNMKSVVDVGVELLHGPHCVLLQHCVQRVLLLDVLRMDSRGSRDTWSVSGLFFFVCLFCFCFRQFICVYIIQLFFLSCFSFYINVFM